MAITINGVTYRNLQQQVLWLTKKVEELEEGGGSGGKDYKAGYGINISNDTISADSTVLQATLVNGNGTKIGATHDKVDIDYTKVQEKLVAGPNITINGNVISATGGGSTTSKTVTDIDFPYGDATVTYDTTDGMTMSGVAKLTFDDGSTVNANCDVEVPIIPGDGINMDADSTGKKVIIKATAQDYVSLTLPDAAIAGNITDSQLATLQASDSAYIIINGKELYYLADKNTVNGILTYTHNGYNEEGIQKYLNLTTATKAFTITEEKSTVEYVDIPSQTGTLGADKVSILTDPMGLNCARYSGHILRLARAVTSDNANVYYYNGLNGATLYTLSLTKDSAGGGIYVVNSMDLGEGTGGTYTGGKGIVIENNVINTDISTGLMYTASDKIAVNTEQIQEKLTAGAGITFGVEDSNVVSVNTGDGLKFSSAGSGEKLMIDDTIVQKKLTAGDNITISDDNVISATGGGSGGKEYTAGMGIQLSGSDNNVISVELADNSGLKFTGALQGEKLTVDDTVIQKKLAYVELPAWLSGNTTTQVNTGILTAEQWETLLEDPNNYLLRAYRQTAENTGTQRIYKRAYYHAEDNTLGFIYSPRTGDGISAKELDASGFWRVEVQKTDSGATWTMDRKDIIIAASGINYYAPTGAVSVDYTEVQKKLVAGDGIVINTGTSVDTIVADIPIVVIPMTYTVYGQFEIADEYATKLQDALQKFPEVTILLQPTNDSFQKYGALHVTSTGAVGTYLWFNAVGFNTPQRLIQTDPGNIQSMQLLGIAGGLTIDSGSVDNISTATYAMGVPLSNDIPYSEYRYMPVLANNKGTYEWQETLPTMPTAGTYVLQCIDGHLQWTQS